MTPQPDSPIDALTYIVTTLSNWSAQCYTAENILEMRTPKPMRDLIENDPVRAAAKLNFLKPLVDNYLRALEAGFEVSDADIYRSDYEAAAGEDIDQFSDSLQEALEKAGMKIDGTG